MQDASAEHGAPGNGPARPSAAQRKSGSTSDRPHISLRKQRDTSDRPHIWLRKRRDTSDRPGKDDRGADPNRGAGADTSSADERNDTVPGQPVDVGEFRQGSPLSQWALARYLVGRAIGESVGKSLMIIGLAILALALLTWWAGSNVWAVLVGIVAIGVLSLRALLLAVLRRLTAAGQYVPLENHLRAIVAKTRGDVLRELRRLGLPGRTWTLPLLAVRLLRRRSRAQTMQRLRSFRVGNAVPQARLDELHLLLRSAVRTDPPPGAGR